MRPCNPFRIGLALLLSLSPALKAQHPTLQTPTQSPATPPAAAPETPASTAPTLSVDARLVNLPVVVRDKNGALIQTLTKADFILQVDNKPQTIRYFDRDTNLPLTLGLLVDTSQSLRSALDDERTASSAFLDQMLINPKDQAFVVQFARQIELLQDLTSSRPKLQAALKDLDTSSSGSNSSDPDDSSSGSRSHAGGAALYDAVFLASDELMSKQKGRKAVIILSDGNDRGSKESLTKAIETAQRADTIIYAIYFKGEEPHHDNNNNNGNQRGNGGGGYPRGGIGFPGGGGGYPGGGGGGRNGGGNNPNRQPESHND